MFQPSLRFWIAEALGVDTSELIDVFQPSLRFWVQYSASILSRTVVYSVVSTLLEILARNMCLRHWFVYHLSVSILLEILALLEILGG